MTNFNSKASRFTIVLINHGKSMMDLDAQFKNFSLVIRDSEAQATTERLEGQYNMRCCVLVNEG